MTSERFDGGGPLWTQMPALGCSVNEEEEEEWDITEFLEI